MPRPCLWWLPLLASVKPFPGLLRSLTHLLCVQSSSEYLLPKKPHRTGEEKQSPSEVHNHLLKNRTAEETTWTHFSTTLKCHSYALWEFHSYLQLHCKIIQYSSSVTNICSLLEKPQDKAMPIEKNTVLCRPSSPGKHLDRHIYVNII